MDEFVRLGAHLVLLHGKRPFETDWHLNPSTSARIINHVRCDGDIGLLPSSLDCAVLDCDRGNPAEVATAFPPFHAYPSRTPGRAHLWYQSNQPVQLHLWAYGDSGGEVISGLKQVALPNPSILVDIYNAMCRITHRGIYLPDVSLITPLTPPSPPQGENTSIGVWKDKGVWDKGVESRRGIGYGEREITGSLIGKVDTSEVGNRNFSLFHALRFWAYKQVRPDDYRVWLWTVEEMSLELREHLPNLRDFPAREARDIAKSVAKFCWKNQVHAGTPNSSVQRARAYKRAYRVSQKNHFRDMEIIAWRDNHKESWRVIGKKMNMSHEGASKAYDNKKAELSRKRKPV